ncbi:hypothetical protein [Devosia sp. CAU 1758]
MPAKKLSAIVAMLLLLTVPASAQELDAGWRTYTDHEFKFSAQLPLGLFIVQPESETPGTTLLQRDGTATLRLYGGPAVGLDRETLEDRLATGPGISEITYRAGDRSWFVLSGFYVPTEPGEQTIFYTKVMFSENQESFSAFEITFPASEKPRFAPIVEHLEDHFTRPQ